MLMSVNRLLREYQRLMVGRSGCIFPQQTYNDEITCRRS